MFDRPPLGRILLSHGVVSDDQLDRAVEYHKEQGCRLGEALVRLGLCSDLEICKALAEQMELPFIDLELTPPNPRVLRMVPKEVCIEYAFIPVRIEGPRLLVAARNPLDIRLDEVIKRVTGMAALVGSACDSQLRQIIRQYDELKWMGTARDSDSRAVTLSSSQQKASPGLVASAEQAHTVQMVDSLIAHAVRRNASEICFEPREDGLHVRGRIDGHMYPMAVVPPQRAESVVTRVKIMGGIPLLDGDTLSAEGTCTTRVDGVTVTLDCSCVRGSDGDVLTLRTRNSGPTILKLDELGLEPEMLETLERALLVREGLILVTAPDHSGRTTTLYSLLAHLVEDGPKVVAVEEKVKTRITGVSHISTGERTAEAFSTAVQLGLSQQPDVLMVAELPDPHTASLVLRAAATGTLVLCGGHARTALAGLARLLDLGIAPNSVAAGLSLILAQRLLRRLCTNCTTSHSISFELNRAFRTSFGNPDAEFKKGRGCGECHGMGTKGRIGVFEMIEADEDLRYLLSDRFPPSVVQQHFKSRGFRSLEEDAFLKASRGIIAPEEILQLRMSLASRVKNPFGKRQGAREDLSSLAEMDTSAWELKPDDDLSSWDEVASLVDTLG